MEKPGNRWSTYHERTQNRPPRESLIKAVSLAREKEIALDLGAGALNDSKYLLEAGFGKVIAVDIEPTVQDAGLKIHNDNLEIVISLPGPLLIQTLLA